jgi:hypothetical protein
VTVQDQTYFRFLDTIEEVGGIVIEHTPGAAWQDNVPRWRFSFNGQLQTHREGDMHTALAAALDDYDQLQDILRKQAEDGN